MKKAILLFAAAFSLYTSSARCVAQELVPAIYLSIGEAAKAKQTAEDLKSVDERNSRAVQAWRDFHERYEAAHPELSPVLRFTSDFRIAIGRKQRSNPFPWEAESTLVTVELSSEERQKTESLHREMLEAKRVADEAKQTWFDYWHQLVLDHVPPKPEAGGSTVTLPGGKSAIIPFPWMNGIVFTPDFRIAVPLQ